MKGAITIFRIFGIDIKLHFSWWFVFVFLSWSLSSSFFPHYFPELSTKMYWMMGITAALFLFVSVLLHELSHSLVAKARRIKVESITLFFFGGVAGIESEDLRPRSEFMMAIAGPLFSLLLAGLFYLIYIFNGQIFWTAITFYLYQLNLILAIFNLIPGYPLDGGRALRAILYAYLGDLRKATRIAASGGRFFAIFLAVLGILSLVTGTGGGLWFILLGGFLYFIAGLSYEQVVLKETLTKIPVSEMVLKRFPTVKPSMPLSAFFKKYLSSGEDVFLVKDKNFSGILDLKQLDNMPPEIQEVVKLKEIAVPLSKIDSVDEKDNAYAAFRKFAEKDLDVLPVKKNSKFLGFVNKRVLMQRLIWELKYGLKEKISKAGKKNIVKKNLAKRKKKK